MSKWDDDELRLDERKASAPETPKHRSKKNTRRWCRGKNGVEHVTEVRLNNMSRFLWDRDKSCYRSEWNSKRWWCNHERFCVNCGKIMKYSLENDCPDFTTKVTVFSKRRRS